MQEETKEIKQQIEILKKRMNKLEELIYLDMRIEKGDKNG